LGVFWFLFFITFCLMHTAECVRVFVYGVVFFCKI